MVLYVGELLYTSHSFKMFIIYVSSFGCAGCPQLHGHSLAAVSRVSPNSGFSCGIRALGCGGFGSCITWAHSCSPWALELQAQ